MMKKQFYLVIIFLLSMCNIHLKADKPQWPGIWAMWGGSGISNADKPWYKGCMGTTNWKTIEPVQGKFDFSEMDKFLNEAAKNNLYIGYMVYVGASTPAWLYEIEVPKVHVDGTVYPFYLNETYKTLLKTMINKVVEHIQSYPPDLQKRIAFMQCPAGTSGDPQPWNGTPDEPEYNIGRNSPEWEAYNKEIFSAYVEAYSILDSPISLLMKPNEDNFNKLNNTVPNLFVKTYTVAQGCQTRDDLKTEWLRNAINKFHNGKAVRARGEMTHIDLKTSDWFDEAPIWNIYSECVWSLTYGMDVLNLRESHFLGDEGKANTKAFEFYSAYAGYKAAEDSHGAWCALRDGLDYDDKVRFPENKFGNVADGKNINRYLNIANAFADRGAKMGETDLCWADGVTWTKQAKAINDVCRRPWKDNYGMFMAQFDPNGTSVGCWRVGSKDEPYGRFSRAFDHASGKDKMFFDIDDAFFFNKPLAAEYPVTVRVIYFDKGTGTWELQYDAIGNATKKAISVKKTDTGKWKDISLELKDANFGNGCPNKTDLMLVNTDSEDDIFHLVEVTRKTGDRKGYWGYVKTVQK